MRSAERVKRYLTKSGETREYRYAAQAAPRSSGDDIYGVMAAWEGSPEWQQLAHSSKLLYTNYMRALKEIGTMRASEVRRQQLLTMRDKIARERGNASAAAFVRTTSAMLSWARNRGIIEHNPILGGVKGLKLGSLPAWRIEEAEIAMRDLPEPLRRAVVLALFTAQRASDLCVIRWLQWDGSSIRLVQQKTGTPVVIPCHPRLSAELSNWVTNRTALTILTDAAGRPWSQDLLRHQIPHALRRIGVDRMDADRKGLNLHGLRKLACIALAEAGCSALEIAAITGHRSISMLQLYCASVSQEKLAQNAIKRWAG